MARSAQWWGICDRCGHRLEAAQDPDGPLEMWCPAVVACEEPGCQDEACGEESPAPCDVCAGPYCEEHLLGRVCQRCRKAEVA